MKSHLQVKVYSLMTEITYIRRKEEKWKTRAKIARQRQKESSLKYAEDNFWSQRHHRAGLKVEARIAHLAYGCMRGVSYAKMENICYGPLKGYGGSEPNWAKIEAMVERFSKDEPQPQNYMQAYGEWLADAKKWYEGNRDRITEMWETKKHWREANAADPAFQASKKVNSRQREAFNRQFPPVRTKDGRSVA